MRAVSRSILAGVLMIGGSLAPGGSWARAQEPGLGGLLGGYGAMAGGGGTSMGGSPAPGGNAMVSFAGKFASAMPSGMGGSGGLSFRPRVQSMDAARPSLVLGSMGGMGRSSAGTGRRRPFRLSGGTLSDGMGLGGTRRMAAPGGMGVMPPRIGYPFRQPPNLLSPAMPGPGMSM